MSEHGKQRIQTGNIYDYVAITYPDTVTEVYTFKIGGSGGTTVEVITNVYTDATKASLLSVTYS